MTLEERLRALELSKSDLIMRVAALESQEHYESYGSAILRIIQPRIKKVNENIKELSERWDNRFIDIETIIGLNHQSEVANIIPFQGRLEGLEKKVQFQQFPFNQMKELDDRIMVSIKTFDEWVTISTNRYEALEQKLSAYRCFQNNCSYTDKIKTVLQIIGKVISDDLLPYEKSNKVREAIKQLGTPVGRQTEDKPGEQELILNFIRRINWSIFGKLKEKEREKYFREEAEKE